MAIDRAVIGTTLEPVTTRVDAGRLALFAKVIGETNPIYTDAGAARQLGHPDIPVPPTFLFGLELEQPDPFGYLTTLGVDLRNLLHGEQAFTYYTVAHAGDILTVSPRIADIYSKKDGALEFIVKQSEVTQHDGGRAADLTTVLVVRHDGAGS